MAFTFMCMKVEFTIKHLFRLDLKVVDDHYQKTVLDRVDLKGHL